MTGSWRRFTALGWVAGSALLVLCPFFLASVGASPSPNADSGAGGSPLTGIAQVGVASLTVTVEASSGPAASLAVSGDPVGPASAAPLSEPATLGASASDGTPPAIHFAEVSTAIASVNASPNPQVTPSETAAAERTSSGTFPPAGAVFAAPSPDASHAEVVTPDALGPVATPTVSATALDVDQALTVTDTIPTTGTGPYSWTWLVSVNGGGYATATECSVDTGSGATAGAAETCNIAGNTLTVGDTYAFELRVTDSEPSTSTSAASPTVTVAAQLTAGAITPGSPTIDNGQTITLTENRAGGTAPHTYQWYSSTSGTGACSSGTALGAGHTQAATPTTDTYYCYVVSDSATTPEIVSSAWDLVTVESTLSAPTAPTVSVTGLDVDQALTVTDTIPSTGTSPYAWAWRVSVDAGAYATETHCAVNTGAGAAGGALETCSIAANVLTGGDTYTFELQVTDSSQGTPVGQVTSGPSSTVSVAPALTAPAAPAVSATRLDLDQSLTVTGVIPSTGTSTYAWTWLVSVNSGAYATAAQCGVDSGSGAAAAAPETCTIAANTLTVGNTYNFELKVTDSATVAETATSAASTQVTVSSALTVPAAPGESAAKLDANQALTVSGTVPSSGTAPYSWQWLVEINGAGGYNDVSAAWCTATGTGATGGAGETCVIPANTLTAGDTYSFELRVQDGASAPETATSTTSPIASVSSTLSAPGAPTPSTTALDVNQPLTVTGSIPSSGTSTYTWTWLISVNGGGYGTATQCAVDSGVGAGAAAPETCSIAAGALTPGDTYTFELKVTDSATVAETQSSAASAVVRVSSTLTSPAAPTVSSGKLDANQALTVTGTIPSTGSSPYGWTWLVSVNGGAYATATQCAVNVGAGATAGATETCSVAAGSLTAVDTYAFELKVTDGAGVPETATSPGSATVTVASALTAPTVPGVSATKLDVNQALTVTGTVPSTGTSPYGWTWLVSVNGGGYVTATQCAFDGGSGAAAGATETCSIGAGSLTAGDAYAFELKVTDGASTPETATSAGSSSVTMASALTAPAIPGVSGTALDVNQAVTITGTVPSSGTSPYGWKWLVSVDGGGYVTATQCAVNSGAGAAAGATETCAIAAGGLTTGDTYSFELSITDGSGAGPETATSMASATVTVSSALTAPAGPGVSATALDQDQSLTVTGTVPSTGTSSYAWSWLVSVNGAGYAIATECAVDGGSGALAGSTESCVVAGGGLTAGDTYAFELKLTDSASAPETQSSVGSLTVVVASPLTAPGDPTVSATSLDADQQLTVTGAVPSTGTSPYLWTWLVSVNGGAYAPATECTANSGGGAAAGSPETCIVVPGTLTVGDNYTFELSITDGATGAETQTSSASSTVTVAAALTSPAAPTLSASSLDADQALTVSGTIPTTGTSPYSWTWLVSVNGGPYGTATECAVDSGTGSLPGAPETCAIDGGTLTAGDTYAFELQVTDGETDSETVTSVGSSTVSVAPALTAPSAPGTSASSLDADQAISVTGTVPSSGTASYSWTWVVSVNGGAYLDTTQCATNAGLAAAGGTTETCTIAAGALTAGDTYSFELVVTDSSGAGAETATSSASSTVSVSSALTPPSGPSVNSTAPYVDQPLTVTGTIPSTGTAADAWTWLVSVNGGPYSLATGCAVASGTGASVGATETCAISGGTLTVGSTYSFELQVTDSATAAETQTSAASLTVTIAAAVSPGSASENTAVWIGTAAGAGLLVALLFAILLVRRRRRPSPPTERPGPDGGEGGMAAAASETAGPAVLGVSAGGPELDGTGIEAPTSPTMVPADGAMLVGAALASAEFPGALQESHPDIGAPPTEQEQGDAATDVSLDSTDIGGPPQPEDVIPPTEEPTPEERQVLPPETEESTLPMTSDAPPDSPLLGPATEATGEAPVQLGVAEMAASSPAPAPPGEASETSENPVATTGEVGAGGEAPAAVSEELPVSEMFSVEVPSDEQARPETELAVPTAPTEESPDGTGRASGPGDLAHASVDISEDGATALVAEPLFSPRPPEEEPTIVVEQSSWATTEAADPAPDDLAPREWIPAEGPGEVGSMPPEPVYLVDDDAPTAPLPLAEDGRPMEAAPAPEGTLLAGTPTGEMEGSSTPIPDVLGGPAGAGAGAPVLSESSEAVGETSLPSETATAVPGNPSPETAEPSGPMGGAAEGDAEGVRTTLAELLRRRLAKNPGPSPAPETQGDGSP